MSPQQAAGEAASVADDIYGFGAMLYELLSGYPPAYGDGKLGAGKTLAALPATVPEPLARLVAQLLAESPADRPADMQSIERELAAVLAAPPAASAQSVNQSARDSVPIRVEPPSARTPSMQGEPLRGEWQRSAPQRTTAADLRRQGFRRGLGAASIAVGVAAVAVVFFALPRWVTSRRHLQCLRSRRRRRSKRRKSTSPRSPARSRMRTIVAARSKSG
jgi:serine/threonine-protein kinase